MVFDTIGKAYRGKLYSPHEEGQRLVEDRAGIADRLSRLIFTTDPPASTWRSNSRLVSQRSSEHQQMQSQHFGIFYPISRGILGRVSDISHMFKRAPPYLTLFMSIAHHLP